MIKKNKIMTTAIGLVAGTCVFASTAMIALANNSNYEAYKNAVFNVVEAKNMTMTMNAELKSNGSVWKSEAIEKHDGNKFYSNTKNSEPGSKTTEYATYNDGESLISYLNNEITYENQFGENSYRNEQNLTEAQRRLVNILIDTAMGDLKNSVLSEGTKISLNIAENQVPVLAQTILDVIAESTEEDSEMFDNQDISMMDIFKAKDISIKQVNFEGDIDNNNFVKYAKGNIVLGGTVSGEYKEMTVSLDFNISDIGTTSVEKPDINVYSKDYYKYDVSPDGTMKNIEFTENGDRIITIEKPENSDN